MPRKTLILLLNAALILLIVVQVGCIVWTCIKDNTVSCASENAAGVEKVEEGSGAALDNIETTLDSMPEDEAELLQIKAELVAKLESLNRRLKNFTPEKIEAEKAEARDSEPELNWSVEEFLAVKDEYPEIYEYVKKELEEYARNRIKNRAQVLKELAKTDISEKEYQDIVACFAAWDEFDAHIEFREYDASEMPLYPGMEGEDAKEFYRGARKRWYELLKDRGHGFEPYENMNETMWYIPQFYLQKEEENE